MKIYIYQFIKKIYSYIYYTTLVRSWSTPFSFGVPFRQDSKEAFPESPGEEVPVEEKEPPGRVEEKEPPAWDALEEEGQDEEQEEGQHEDKEEGQGEEQEEEQHDKEEERQDGEEEKKQHDELQEAEDSPEWVEWDPTRDPERRNRKEWPAGLSPETTTKEVPTQEDAETIGWWWKER